MKSGRLKNKSYSLLLVVLLLAILILVNYLGLENFTRLDLTQNREFTISLASRNLLEGLPDLVHIKVYFSESLPPYLANLQRQVQDLLDEYRAYSGGKLRVQFINPESDPQTEQRVQQLGIPKLQLNIIEKDKAQVQPAYMGMAILYEDKKEILPIIKGIENLEYELTTRISKLTNPEVKTIAFLTGHHERDINEEYSELRQALEKQYKIITVETAAGEPIPDEVSTLVVAKPEEMSPRDKYELDQFFMRGGKLVFLLDWIKMDQGLRNSSINTQLDDLLEHYGVKLNHDLVIDTRFNFPATFSTGFLNFQVPYPYWIRVTRQNLAADHPAMHGLETIMFPWCSSLSLLEDKLKDHEVIKLVSSSPYSWNKTGSFFNLDPQQRITPQTDSMPHLLAVAIIGKFESFFAGKEIPPLKKKTEEKDTAENKNEMALEVPKTPQTIPQSPENQLVVISNSRLFNNNFINQFNGNALFFLNLMDWLNVGSELIKIRARQVHDHPLKEISDRQKGSIKFANSFGIALIVVLFGLARLYLRRRAQHRYQVAISERK
jgi:ABC-2 type transport system permease protein